MKNRRNVCLATNTGYADYKDYLEGYKLDALIHKSHFCQLHKPNVAKRQNIQVTDESCTSIVPKESAITCRDTVGFIIGTRVTRSSTLYQVQYFANKTVELLSSKLL